MIVYETDYENPTVAILGGAGEMGRTAVAIVSQFQTDW